MVPALPASVNPTGDIVRHGSFSAGCAMSEQQLREQLLNLQVELQTLPADSPQRESMAALIAEIEAQLEDGPIEALVEQVEGAVTVFEAEHPRIAAVLNNIIVTLTGMGV